MNRSQFTAGCLWILFCLLTTSTATEKIIYVDDDAAGANDGSSWNDAFVYLQDALASASPSLPSRRRAYGVAESNGVEIRVAQGTYTPHQFTVDGNVPRVPPEAAFGLRSGMSLRGGYAGVGMPDPNERNVEIYRTILSGDLNGDDVEVQQPHDLPGEPTRRENSRCIIRCYDAYGTPVVLDGVLVTGATYSAMENLGGEPVISDCVFTWNAGHFGGGAIYSQRGSLVLTRCRFVSNWAQQFGGAICPDYGTTVVLTDCAFLGNQAGVGGAVAGEDADITMTGCTFERNAAERQGALHCMGGTLLATDCTFRENSAPLLSTRTPSDGGAIGFFGEVDVTISNCRFEGNWAALGGAIYSEYSRQGAILRDCVFSGNSASRGGALFGLSGSTVANCVFAGNRAGWGGAADSDCTGPEFVNCTFVANGADNGNAIARYSCHGLPEQSIRMTNCILWDGGNEIGTADNTHPIRYLKTDITFSDVFGGWGGQGNLNVDPCFADPGHWDPNGTPDDSADDIWVNGDYHLKSQAGRWDPASESWVLDEVTSPCIDAGDPNVPVGDEPEPNGGRVNLGAYGGTNEASKSP